MRALTVVPEQPDSLRVDDIAEPDPSEGSVLVEVIAVGLCGTDAEIIAGAYGAPPPGKDRLVLGHESLGRVVEAPQGCGLQAGDHVICIVRLPDPVPCANCAAGRWDMCLNGQFTEHGINGVDGFLRERYRTDPDRLVVVDSALGDLGVLMEPTTIVAKAWNQIELIAQRSPALPSSVLITGAGPIGLLAALLGTQRGLDVHVFDRAEGGLKPDLVNRLGATFHNGNIEDIGREFDVVIECTGADVVVISAIQLAGADGIACLTGVSAPGRTRAVDMGAINRALVLDNGVVVGTVNASREHYHQAADALAQADRDWLAAMITRRVPLPDQGSDLSELARGPHDVKVVVVTGR